NLDLTGGSLTVGGPIVLDGTLTVRGALLVLDNSTVAGSGTLNNQGTVLALGTSAIPVALTTAAGSTLRVLGRSRQNAVLATGRGFRNKGVLELTSDSATASATLTVSGTLINAAGGTVNILAGAGGGRVLNASLDNRGTVTVQRTATLNTTAPSVNTGTVSVS